MEKLKFEKIYDEDEIVSGYKCGKFYIMKHYTWGNKYNWVINEDGSSYYFQCELDEQLAQGKIFFCETLKDAKQKVCMLMVKESKEQVQPEKELTEIEMSAMLMEYHLRARELISVEVQMLTVEQFSEQVKEFVSNWNEKEAAKRELHDILYWYKEKEALALMIDQLIDKYFG